MRREGSRVTPLELFFDLVFVLAITQCTSLMAARPTWAGVGQAMVILAVLWWAWVGYAWLTSVLDPEEGLVRAAMFAAMAALLVAALCVPEAFDDAGLIFAVAYGAVRIGHIFLFALASRELPELRRSVWTGLVPSTSVSIALLVIASQLDGTAQGVLWVVAIALDMIGPFVFGAEGWQLEPGHFAERHGLIFLIALGESVVAIGVGAGHEVTRGVAGAAVLGVALCAAMWWAYFDVTSLLAERSLTSASEGRERNELARDAYSLLHLPIVAGVVLAAFGLKVALHEVDQPLARVPGSALTGGVAVFVLGNVAFKWRTLGTVSPWRLLTSAALLAVVPLAWHVDAIVMVAIASLLLWALVTYESVRFAQTRDEVRHADGGRTT